MLVPISPFAEVMGSAGDQGQCTVVPLPMVAPFESYLCLCSDHHCFGPSPTLFLPLLSSSLATSPSCCSGDVSFFFFLLHLSIYHPFRATFLQKYHMLAGGHTFMLAGFISCRTDNNIPPPAEVNQQSHAHHSSQQIQLFLNLEVYNNMRF